MLTILKLLIVPLMAIMIFCAVKLFKTFFKLNSTLGWFSGLVFFVCLPFSLVTLNGGVDLAGWSASWTTIDLSDSKFVFSYFMIWILLIISFLVIIVCLSARKHHLMTNGCLKRVSTKYKKVILLLMGMMLIDWIIRIWSHGGIVPLIISDWYSRGEMLYEEYGHLYVLYNHILTAVNFLFVVLSIYHVSQTIHHRRIFFATPLFFVIAIFLLLQMIVSGNRIFIASFGVALFTLFIIKKSMRSITISILLIFLLVPFFGMWAVIRGNVTDWSERKEFYHEVVSRDNNQGKYFNIAMDAFEGVGVTLLFNVINDFGEREKYLYGQSYYRIFTFFLPRTIYPEKSSNITTVFAEIYEPGIDTSLVASVIGDMYANFSLFTLIILPFTTFIVVLFDLRKSRKYSTTEIDGILGFVLIFCATRFGISSMIIYALFTIVLYKVSFILVSLSFKHKHSI